MKYIGRTIAMMATTILLSGTTLLAADNTNLGNSMDKKDECLLISRNCTDEVDSIQQRIERLNKEIAKGTDVYTRDELKTLIQKRDETIRMYQFLTIGG